VALAALRDDKTLAQLCQEFDLHANQIAEWKRQLIERAAHAFDGGAVLPQVDLVPLQAKIGQRTLENDFLERALNKAGLLSAKR
jgi:transposase-like protein